MAGHVVPHTVDRVRIRPGKGPRSATTARRLARIAHQHLGPALDRALADVEDDLDVERVTVTFPADPEELDDEAVAMLWASLVRASLERLRCAAPPRATLAAAAPAADDDPTDTAVPASGNADLVAVVGALQRWIHDGTPPSEAELDLALSRPGLAERALSQLPEPWPSPARELLDRRARARSGSTTAPQDSTRSPGPGAPASAPRAERPDAWRGVSESVAALSSAPHAPGLVPGETRVPPVPTEITEPSPARLPMSSWGGLVLLHYRLRPYLERAVEAEPDLAAAVVRTAALNLVVGDPAVAADPLVALLSERPDWRDVVEPDPFVWRNPTEATDRAERLLRDFAGDLPGFGASSGDFVREQWLRRRALLLEDPPAVLLTLEPRPLDLVLDRLPYPIGALRLPWTPPLFVGWERP